jgi:UDP-2-acetamido-3-amino-2,3-dideoxy-glucuronate N-acetyltransferase
MSDLVHPGSCQPLSVHGCSLITLRQHRDDRGPLAVLGQGEAVLPFSPQRLFLTHHATGTTRGEHAHRVCAQLLLCPHGSLRVRIDDGRRHEEVLLDQPHLALYVPPLVWAEQFDHSPDAVLIVAASHPYDATDYLRTRSDWLQALQQS